MCGYFVLAVRMGFLFFFIEANIFYGFQSGKLGAVL